MKCIIFKYNNVNCSVPYRGSFPGVHMLQLNLLIHTASCCLANKDSRIVILFFLDKLIFLLHANNVT